MAGAFLSADWYRVAPLRPRLRSHVEIHRQRFRGEIWYILQDLHSGKYHRISPAANLVVSLMDGRRSLQRLWELACDRFPDDPPTQADLIRLLSQLHASDLIAGDVPPDIAEMGRRYHDNERRTMLARLRNPLALRFPLFDPDAILSATQWIVRPLFTVWGFLLWLALVITGVTLAVMNWGPLTQDLSNKVLSGQNLAVIALAYPIIKALHEMGHAYSTKIWGGEVHEIGVMFLVLIPVPYVDASASAAFPQKWRRAVVGGAGIMVEMALAAIAMIFWINAEPGLARTFAFNVILIGGVSTLLFNGNPLLRFDGYFVFADILEIPNLGARSGKYFWYLVQRYLLRIKTAQSPVTARGEAKWLLTYGIAAFFYRLLITFGISLFIASKFFFVGVILAIWALSNVFVMPIFKGLKFLFTHHGLRGRRGVVLTLSAGVVLALGLLVFYVPVPHATMAEGVVILDETQILRAETDGFVTQIATEQGQVAAGAVLARLEDPVLATETRLAVTRLDEIRLQLNAAVVSDQVEANALREQMRFLQNRLDLYQARSEALTVSAPAAGRALLPGATDLTGKLVHKGAVLGYLLADQPLRLRVAVPQAQAELVRGTTVAVSYRLQRDLGHAIAAKIIASTPESQPVLPAAGLGAEAGGPFATDPGDPSHKRTLESLFVFDLAPSDDRARSMVGERAIVRFDHGPEPLGLRIYRNIRQLFLSRFNV